MTHPASSARVHGLDTLRALAIVLVFMYHYTAFVSSTDTFGFLSRIGWVGVDLFFALSGYLIGNQIFSAMRSGRAFSLKNFYARRLLRTLPNYYVILALFALWPAFRSGMPMPELWKFLSFTQNYELKPGTAFSHAWSLCIEEQFYMVLPAAALAIAALRRSRIAAWVAIAAVVAGGMLVRALMWIDHVDGAANVGFVYHQFIYYSSFCRLDELVAGVALALVRNYHAPAWQRLTAHGNLVLCAGIAATGFTFWLLLADSRGFVMTIVGYPMLALGFALLIVAAVSDNSLLRSTRIPGAASLALWSYAVYLTHKQACLLGYDYLNAMGMAPDAPATVAMLAFASVASGWLLYRAVELPFMALREKVVPSNFADTASSSAIAGAVRGS